MPLSDLSPTAPTAVRANEREELLAALARQRDALRVVAYGLDDIQSRATPRPAEVSIRTLVELATRTEREWIARLAPAPGWPALRAAWAAHRHTANDTLTDLLRAYAGAAVETAEVVGGVDDLGGVVGPFGDEPDGDGWTARRVLLHLIEETARLAGHAGMVRQGVDGATFYALDESTAA